MAARRRSPKGVLLFPGAGSDASHTALVAIEEALSPVPVRRSDFPYRRAGKRPPDRAPVLVAWVRKEATSFAAELATTTDRLVLGGRSMGGRMCSLAVAGAGPGAVDDGPALRAAGLVLVSYPLHPPGKPYTLRVAHLERLAVPCLFVHGTRDPFGTPDELAEWTRHVPGPVTHHWVEGGRHDLRKSDTEVAETVTRWWSGLR
jgi:predicted alpha/beta-hydrolase family hydrolase